MFMFLGIMRKLVNHVDPKYPQRRYGGSKNGKKSRVLHNSDARFMVWGENEEAI